MNDSIPNALPIQTENRWQSKDIFWFSMLALMFGIGIGSCSTLSITTPHRTERGQPLAESVPISNLPPIPQDPGRAAQAPSRDQ